MSTEMNKSVVRRYLEDVWGKGNVNLLRDLVSQDVTDHNPSPGQPCGFEGQEWAARGFLKGVSNAKMTVDQLVGQGDLVVDHWTYSATHTGEMFGMPATGRKFTITGSDWSRLENGKLAEIWHVEDMLSLMQQLGLAPVPQGLPASFGRPASSTTRPSTTDYGTSLSDNDKKDKIRGAFRKFIDQGDLNTAGDFITPDFVGHFSGGFPPVYGIDGFKQFLSIYINSLSNRRAEIEEIIVDGDKAACRARYYGKNTGSMLGTPATGRSIDTTGLNIFRFAGDKVAEQYQNSADLLMMQQLGVVPVQAGMETPEPC